VPGTADDPPPVDCSDGEIHEDGSSYGGYSWQAADNVIAGVFVELFTPPAYPYAYARVCSNWCRFGTDSTLAYNVVFYDDDGPQGSGGEPSPGTLLAVVPAVAEQVTECYVQRTWHSADVSGQVPAITEGSVFVGVMWNAVAEVDFFLSVDSSVATPEWIGYHSPDGDAPWDANHYLGPPDYRALLIRASGPAPSDLIFGDGFESGTSDAWSNVLP
jgi:hypothetical protein